MEVLKPGFGRWPWEWKHPRFSRTNRQKLVIFQPGETTKGQQLPRHASTVKFRHVAYRCVSLRIVALLNIKSDKVFIAGYVFFYSDMMPSSKLVFRHGTSTWPRSSRETKTMDVHGILLLILYSISIHIPKSISMYGGKFKILLCAVYGGQFNIFLCAIPTKVQMLMVKSQFLTLTSPILLV